jgi:inorganic pyrophosphatase
MLRLVIKVLYKTTMINFAKLPVGEGAPEIINAVIEIPYGSGNKYEYDEKLGVFRLDRTLYSPVHYPGDYGFVPSTRAEDGDPLDIVVLTSQPSFPGCVIEARPIGALEMRDDKGMDVKILAVPTRNPRYDEMRDLSDVPKHTQREFDHFFQIYKELEGKKSVTYGWKNRKAALRFINAAIL